MAPASAIDSPAPASTADAAPPPDLDALLNRANLALARSRRLVASWLPTPESALDGAEAEADCATHDDEADDDAMFEPMPELYAFPGLELFPPLDLRIFHRRRKSADECAHSLGVGAKPTTSGTADPWLRGPRGDVALRKRMLGARAAAAVAGQHVGSRPRPRPTSTGEGEGGENGNVEADDDDEAAGRTAVVGKGKKRRRVVEAGEAATADEDADGDGAREGEQGGGAVENAKAAGRSKRPGSYLDEVLEAKRRKAKRKKKRKEGAIEDTGAVK